MREQHLRITIQDANGREFKMTYREPFNGLKNRDSIDHFCNITLNSKVGDKLQWRECDFHFTERVGVCTEAIRLIWDYSKPVGERAIFL